MIHFIEIYYYFYYLALYDGYKSSEYKGSEVLDMGRGRFDFQYGIQVPITIFYDDNFDSIVFR
jgi:hypothetical protein